MKDKIKILWKREWNENTVCIDLPMELWYKCPKCKILSEGLMWSEYNNCLWCDKCSLDIPSCLCTDDIDKAIEIYVSWIRDYFNNK